MKKIFSLIMVCLILATQLSFVFAYEDEEFYIQVGAFESKYNADKQTNYMIQIGYDAVTIKVFDLYKVFLGPYKTEEQARSIADDFKSSGGSGFFIAASDIYYKPPAKEAVEETTEEVVEETTDDVVEEVVEETKEEVVEETKEEVVEETEEETKEEVIEETKEEPIEVSVVAPKVDETPDYKLFTITLIVMLWVLFIIILVVYRLIYSKNSTK